MSEQHDHKLCPNTTVNKNLQIEVDRLREEVIMLRDKAVIGEERSIQMFDILADIKESVKGINDTIRVLMARPDPFKEQIYRLGLRVVELSIMGGVIYMAVQGKL